MEKKKNVLDYSIRKNIYNIVLKNPGLHLREIDRKTNISFGALRYHINYLQKKGLIKKLSDEGFTRYYITNKVGNGDKKFIRIFRHKTLCKIICIFLFYEWKSIIYKKDLLILPIAGYWSDNNKTKVYILKHRTTLDYHLKKLVENNILVTVQYNGKTGYKIVNYEEIWDFLIRFKDAMSNEFIDQFLYYCDENSIPNGTDYLLKNIWDTFPHPYHV